MNKNMAKREREKERKEEEEERNGGRKKRAGPDLFCAREFFVEMWSVR